MRMYKLEQDIAEELYEEHAHGNCGVKRLADTIVNHYFKEYLDEVVEQLEYALNDCIPRINGKECNKKEKTVYAMALEYAIEIVKGGGK